MKLVLPPVVNVAGRPAQPAVQASLMPDTVDTVLRAPDNG